MLENLVFLKIATYPNNSRALRGIGRFGLPFINFKKDSQALANLTTVCFSCTLILTKLLYPAPFFFTNDFGPRD